MDHLGTDGDGKYCVVPQDQVIKTLVLYCWPYEARFGDRDEAVRNAERALERWVTQGLPCREQAGKRYFDPAQVINSMKWAGVVHGDPAFQQGAVPSWRQTVEESLPAGWPEGRGMGLQAPARFAVCLRREFNLRGCSPGSLVRLRVPAPLEEQAQGPATVEVVEPKGGGARVTVVPGRVEVRLPVPERPAPVSVEVRVTVSAYWQSFEVDAAHLEGWETTGAEYQLYTRRSEGLVRVTDLVDLLADELAGRARNPWEAVNAFWAFFFDRLKLGQVHYDELDPADPLASVVRRGWFDCLAGSALLVGLCRARGIPARLVSGFQLYSLPAYHYWAEVLLPPYGWVPLDLGSWDLAAGRADCPRWGRFFLGRLDYRMKTECFPHHIVGNPGVRFPAAWYMVSALTREGSETSYYSLSNGELLYRDHIRVCRQPDDGPDPRA
jgi:hypothetical protein